MVKKSPTSAENPGQTEVLDPLEPDATGDSLETTRKPTAKAIACVELRLRSATWEEIAETVGYASPQQAANVFAQTIAHLAGPPETYRAMQAQMTMQLDGVLRSLHPLATQTWLLDPNDPEPDPKLRRRIRNEQHLAAAREYRGTLEQKARLLGLNAPTRVQIETPGAKEMDELIGEIVAVKVGELPASGNVFDLEADDEGVYTQVRRDVES